MSEGAYTMANNACYDILVELLDNKEKMVNPILTKYIQI